MIRVGENNPCWLRNAEVGAEARDPMAMKYMLPTEIHRPFSEEFYR